MDLTKLSALCDSVRGFHETHPYIDTVNVSSTSAKGTNSVFATVHERDRIMTLGITYKSAEPPAEEVS